MLKHDPQPAEVAEEYAVAREPVAIPEEGGVPVLKHDLPPAEVAEEYAA